MKQLFWITAKWKKAGQHFALMFLTAADDVDAAKAVVTLKMREDKIGFQFGDCFIVPECFCKTTTAKIVFGQQL